MKTRYHRQFHLPTLVFCLALFCLNGILAFAQPVCREINILKKINSPEKRPLTIGMKFTSKTVTPLAIAFSAGIIGAGLIQDKQPVTIDGLQLGSSVILASLASTGLKYAINRKRPGTPDDGIIRRIHVGDPSFPSGHTTVAFALATAASILYPKWYVIGPCSAWAGTVAVSRMYLGVHFPTDILGGMAIGTGFSFLVWQGRRWIEKN